MEPFLFFFVLPNVGFRESTDLDPTDPGLVFELLNIIMNRNEHGHKPWRYWENNRIEIKTTKNAKHHHHHDQIRPPSWRNCPGNSLAVGDFLCELDDHNPSQPWDIPRCPKHRAPPHHFLGLPLRRHHVKRGLPSGAARIPGFPLNMAT